MTFGVFCTQENRISLKWKIFTLLPQNQKTQRHKLVAQTCVLPEETNFKQDGRPPPAYFPPSNSAKDTFEKDESVFLFGETPSSAKKRIFFIIKISLISEKKTLNSGGKKTFL